MSPEERGLRMRFDLTTAAIVILAIWVLTPAPARAGDVPATAGDFAAYCTPLKHDCRSKITEVQVAAMAQAMANSSTKACSVPEGIEEVVADKAIVGWISNHPNAANMTTADGINASIKALWNCQESIASGVTSLGAPDKVGAFVTFCADTANYNKCANQIVQASVDASAARTFNGQSVHCSAPDDVKTSDAAAKVLAWLQEHKEFYGDATTDGTAAAVDHLWPCH